MRAGLDYSAKAFAAGRLKMFDEPDHKMLF